METRGSCWSRRLTTALSAALAVSLAAGAASPCAYAASGVVGQSGQIEQEESAEDFGAGAATGDEPSPEAQDSGGQPGASGLMPQGEDDQPSSSGLAAQADNAPVVGDVFTDGSGVKYTVYALPSDDAAGSVRVSDAKSCTAKTLTFSTVEYKGAEFAVAGADASAFEGNAVLEEVSFADVPARASFYAKAFKGCTALEKVRMPAAIGGIAGECFSGCTALERIDYPAGATLQGTIGKDAFSGCTSLETLVIPAMLRGARRADFYHTFEEYNGREANVNSTYEKANVSFGGIESTHFNDQGPLGGASLYSNTQTNESKVTIVSGCPKLKTIVFMPGSPVGAFAFSGRVRSSGSDNAPYFEDCPALESIVYETAQPWYFDPNGMSDAGTYYKDALALIEGVGLYYAVDYYATAEAAAADDRFGSGRLARVEYRRGTPASLIATGGEGASGYAFADASAYAQKEGDGAVPDPNEVAREQGLDAGKRWVWHLTGTQSRRDGLSDSCKAYLAEAGDLQNGRLDGSAVSALYRVCDMMCSSGEVNGEAVQDTKFGPEQAYFHSLDYFLYKPAGYSDSQPYDPWVSLGGDREASLQRVVTVRDAEGEALDWGSLDVAYQRYDAESGQLVDETLATCGDGPLLLTITPKGQGALTGELKEWVFVKVHSGTVVERYTDSAADTWAEASRPPGVNNLDYQGKGVPYSVGISTADAAGAVVAAGYAGLTGSPIHAADTEDASFGFQVGTVFLASGRFDPYVKSDKVSFDRRQDTLQDYSVAAYRAFESVRESNSVGASREGYPWGDTAVLVNPAHLNDVGAAATAYAYAMKAPVFYSAEDGGAGQDLLDVLSGFGAVAVFGDESCFSADAYDALAASLGDGASVARVQGDARSASSLTLAVAKLLADEGKASLSCVAISDASDVVDAVSSLEFTGFSGGVALVSACTADSKVIASYLAESKDDLNTVMLFGRDGSNLSSGSFDLHGYLSGLWSGPQEAPAVGQGDTLVLSGARYAIGAGDVLEYSDDLWEHEEVPAGTYRYAGGSYTIKGQDDGADDGTGAQDPGTGGKTDDGTGAQDPGTGGKIGPIDWGVGAASPTVSWMDSPAIPAGVSGRAQDAAPGGVSGWASPAAALIASAPSLAASSGKPGAAGTASAASGGGWLTVGDSPTGAAGQGGSATPSSAGAAATASGSSGNRLVMSSSSSSTDNGEDDAESHSNPTARTGVVNNATPGNAGGSEPGDAAAAGGGAAAPAAGQSPSGTLDPSADIRDAREDETPLPADADGETGSLPPAVVGGAVAAVVAALGGALWFAMRRPNGEAEFDEEMIES